MNQKNQPNPDPFGNLKRLANELRRYRDPVVPPEAIRAMHFSPPGVGSLHGQELGVKLSFPRKQKGPKRYRMKSARRVGDVRKSIRTSAAARRQGNG